MKKFIAEFKEFAMKGNVVDMAIGVVIGAAFGKITTSLVNDVIMPLISRITGGVDFSAWKWVLKAAEVDETGAETAADFEGLIKGAGGRAAQAVSGVDYAAAAHSHGMSDVSGLEAALGGKQPKKLLRAGAAVAASDWTDDAQGRYADYPKTALIAVEGAQESMLPEVIFSVADALSGNFAPAAVSVGGGVRIYAKEVPEGSVTVTAVLWA